MLGTVNVVKSLEEKAGEERTKARDGRHKLQGEPTAVVLLNWPVVKLTCKCLCLYPD